MRVAFVGKGGSGKTTLASLLSRYMAAVKQLPVLAIDADINQHFAEAIGMPEQVARSLPPLGIEINRIKEYLRGDNPRITSTASMVKTTPPGPGSRMLRFEESNPVFDFFASEHGNIRVMAVGEFTEQDLGIKCYHSKVGAVELILNHLIDGPKQYVVIDMTAGADSFASGMFTKFDLTLLVVEPTLKSLSVYNQYKNYAQNYGIFLKVVANKIESRSDVDFIRDRVGEDFLGYIKKSEYIKAGEKGIHSEISNLEEENKQALDVVISALDSCQKDWKKFYSDAVYFHIKNAESWANAAVGEDLTLQIDPNFEFVSRLA